MTNFMTICDVLCPWNKETDIVIKCRKLSYVCRKLSWHFLSRPLPAVPFWFSPTNAALVLSTKSWKICSRCGAAPKNKSKKLCRRAGIDAIQEWKSPQGLYNRSKRPVPGYPEKKKYGGKSPVQMLLLVFPEESYGPGSVSSKRCSPPKVFRAFLTLLWRISDAFWTFLFSQENKTHFDAFLTHFWRIADAFSENTFWMIPTLVKALFVCGCTPHRKYNWTIKSDTKVASG